MFLDECKEMNCAHGCLFAGEKFAVCIPNMYAPQNNTVLLKASKVITPFAAILCIFYHTVLFL